MHQGISGSTLSGDIVTTKVQCRPRPACSGRAEADLREVSTSLETVVFGYTALLVLGSGSGSPPFLRCAPARAPISSLCWEPRGLSSRPSRSQRRGGER